MPINNYYQTYGIFTSQEPTLSDLIQANQVYKINNILSLDRDSYTRVSALIRQGQQNKKLGNITYNLYNLDPSNPSTQARNLFQNILKYVKGNSNEPILIHCRAGKDRTGFAVASFLIKKGIAAPCVAITQVKKTLGYGSGGISPTVKNTLDKILGCNNLSEINDSDDAVSSMRDHFGHQQGSLNSGTVDGGYWADNIGFGNNWVDVNSEKYPGPIGTQARRKFINRIIRIASFFEGGPQGSPTADQLPSSTTSPAIPNYITIAEKRKKRREKLLKILKKIEDEKEESIPENNNLGQVGLSVSYMGGQIANTFNTPSGAPGAPGAASPSEPTGYVQL